MGFYSCGSAPSVQTASVEEDPASREDDDGFGAWFPAPAADLPVSAFDEIWVYVVAGREEALRPGLPISDIGYFGAEVNSYGTLVDVPNRRKLSAFSGRVHLVVACNGRALSHFVLKPGSAERKALIADLLAACKDYDGLQIDFENIPQQDGEPYLSFLKELRAGLGKKMLTVALAARTGKITDDVYGYEKILPVVDRILVMAYDEHWSTSEPGPVASLAWCRRVADYSMKVIGKEKLIMGLPFYGRGWGRPNHSQAYVYTGIERIIKENNVREVRRENGIPTFDYNANISVKVFYEDEQSLSTRMEMYRSMGVSAIGFWRLGQETQAVWPLLKLGSRK
jgi:spore germination protein YaaH